MDRKKDLWLPDARMIARNRILEGMSRRDAALVAVSKLKLTDEEFETLLENLRTKGVT